MSDFDNLEELFALFKKKFSLEEAREQLENVIEHPTSKCKQTKSNIFQCIVDAVGMEFMSSLLIPKKKSDKKDHKSNNKTDKKEKRDKTDKKEHKSYDKPDKQEKKEKEYEYEEKVQDIRGHDEDCVTSKHDDWQSIRHKQYPNIYVKETGGGGNCMFCSMAYALNQQEKLKNPILQHLQTTEKYLTQMHVRHLLKQVLDTSKHLKDEFTARLEEEDVGDNRKLSKRRVYDGSLDTTIVYLPNFWGDHTSLAALSNHPVFKNIQFFTFKRYGHDYNVQLINPNHDNRHLSVTRNLNIGLLNLGEGHWQLLGLKHKSNQYIAALPHRIWNSFIPIVPVHKCLSLFFMDWNNIQFHGGNEWMDLIKTHVCISKPQATVKSLLDEAWKEFGKIWIRKTNPDINPHMINHHLMIIDTTFKIEFFGPSIMDETTHTDTKDNVKMIVVFKDTQNQFHLLISSASQDTYPFTYRQLYPYFQELANGYIHQYISDHPEFKQFQDVVRLETELKYKRERAEKDRKEQELKQEQYNLRMAKEMQDQQKAKLMKEKRDYDLMMKKLKDTELRMKQDHDLAMKMSQKPHQPSKQDLERDRQFAMEMARQNNYGIDDADGSDNDGDDEDVEFLE